MTTDHFIMTDGERIPIVYTAKSGARNIILRPKIAPVRELHVSIPRLTPVSRARVFIEEKRRWLERIFARAPQKVKLRDGDTINIFGEEYLILHSAGDINAEQKYIAVGGSPEFFERRLRDKIKEMFLIRVKEILKPVPQALRPSRIVVRDTTSRWGSCSSTGTISLSYRLAFAPPDIMKYVIMHELAHRKHMDHSPKFWGLLGQLYGPGVERAKQWLSKNGQTLHRYF
ncbi:MAG: M48 family metallopeptidase [Alphaproteobacteria bacterium]|nr:M48 family metallopeptidase [Alphaproteobacteria bacterium]